MSSQVDKAERLKRLRELLVRRAAVRREIRILDNKIASLSLSATLLRKAA